MNKRVKSALAFLLAVIFVLPSLCHGAIVGTTPDDPFCGVWEYDEHGSKNYVRLIKVAPDNYNFAQGYHNVQYGDKNGIVWISEHMGRAGVEKINLKSTNGVLKGQFKSHNFRPTHGLESLYRLLISSKSPDTLEYSVYMSLTQFTEKSEMKRFRDCASATQ